MFKILLNDLGFAKKNKFSKENNAIAMQKQNSAQKGNEGHRPLDVLLLVADYLSPADMVTAAHLCKTWRNGIYYSRRWRLMQEAAKHLSPENLRSFQKNEVLARIERQTNIISFTGAAAAGISGATVVTSGILIGRKQNTQYLQKMCDPYAHLGIDVSHYNFSTVAFSRRHYIVNAKPLCLAIAGEYNMTMNQSMVANLQDSGILAGIATIHGSDVVTPNTIGPFPGYNLSYIGGIIAGVTVATTVLCLGATIALNYLMHQRAIRPRHDIENGIERQDQVNDIENAGMLLPQDSAEISTIKIPHMILPPGLVVSRLRQLESLEVNMFRAFRKNNLDVIRKLGPAFKAAEQVGISSVHARLYCEAVRNENHMIFAELRLQNGNFIPEQMTHFLRHAPVPALLKLFTSHMGRSLSLPQEYRIANIAAEAIRQIPAAEFPNSTILFDQELLAAFFKAAGNDVERFIRATTPEGHTALHLVAFRGNDHIAELLLAHGADWDVKDNAGLMPCQLVPFYENLKPLRQRT